MLKLMREKATSWLIKVLLGAIVVVFVFWGVGSFRAQKGDRVATVNGDVITLADYKEAYNNLVERLRQNFGNRLNEDMLKTLRVKEQALNLLIDNRLLVQEAQRLKLRVPDEELAEAIMHFGAFQSAGAFNSRLYQNVLNRLRLTPEEFEVVQRESMLAGKLRLLVTESVKVSDQEAREWYNWQNASVNIDFVTFEPDRYTNINPAPEEIKAYFEDHKTSYKTEPMVKVRYLQFTPDAYWSKVTVSDDEIRNYYNTKQEEFKKPKTVEARHILLKLDRDASPEAVEKEREKALKILKMAQDGKDFAELAKQYSEGPSKDRGGYLGEFQKDDMVKPFADRAFAMNPGEVGGPVRTQFGWHIIKVEKVSPAAILSLSAAKDKIFKKLRDEKARSLAYDEAEAVSDVSFGDEDLVRVAKERNLKVLTTDFFTKSGPKQGVGNPVKFASAAFDLQIMAISDIQDFGEGYYILQVVEKIPSKIPEFEAVKDRARADLIKEKQDQKAREDANTLLAALKSGKALGSEAKNYKLETKSTGFFKRDDSIPEIGFQRKIAETAFKLSDDKKFPEEVIKNGQRYYVIQFKERKSPDSLGFGSEEQNIKLSLLEQKKARIFNAYLEQIKSKSKITIKEDFL
ncbi:MAG: SurA N-terminal domain-containing protein [Pseudomonadota bacterium]